MTLHLQYGNVELSAVVIPEYRIRWQNPSYLTRIVGEHNNRLKNPEFKIKNLPAAKKAPE